MANHDLISLDFTEESTGISLEDTSFSSGNLPLTEKGQEDRIGKYKYVLPNMPEDIINSSVSSRDEAGLKDHLVLKELEEGKKTREELIQELLQNSTSLTPMTKELLKELPVNPPKDTETALERNIARKFTDQAFTLGGDVPDSEEAIDKIDATQIALQRQASVQTVREELEAYRADQGYLGFGSDLVEELVPLLNKVRIRSNFKNEDFVANSFLPGNTLEEQVSFLWNLPPEQFHRTLKDTVEVLREKNVFAAQEFLDSVQFFASSEKLVQNILGVIEVGELLPLGTLGKAVSKGGKLVKRTPEKEVQDAAEAMVKESSRKDVTPEDLLAAAGNTDEAAEIAVPKVLEAIAGGLDPKNRFKALMDTIPSIGNPRLLARGASKLTREKTNRITERLQQNSARLLSTLNTNKANRQSLASDQAAMEEAVEWINNTYNRVEDAILDVSFTEIDDSAVGIRQAVVQMGRVNGSTFKTAAAARNNARLYGIDEADFTIKSQGKDSYFIEVKKDVAERSNGILDNLTIGTDNISQRSLANSFITGSLRGAADFLSPLSLANRNAVTHMAEETNLILQDIIKDLGKLSKKRTDKLNQVMKINRDTINADGTRGMFFKSIGEFEDVWLKTHKELPDEKDIQAYFTFVQLSDLDWVVRNMHTFKAKAVAGLRQYRIPGSEWFEGKEVKNIPWDIQKDANLLFTEGGQSNIISKSQIGDTNHPIRKAIENGEYRIIQNAEAGLRKEDGTRVLNEITKDDSPIQFVLTKKIEQKDLTWEQVPYRPGGHIIYKNPWYVKQVRKFTGRGGKTFYDGDTALFNPRTKKEAIRLAKSMEEARLALKAKDDVLLQKIIDNDLPYTKSQFTRLFDGDKGLDIDAPISWVPENKRILDEDVKNGVDKSQFIQVEDLSDDPYSLYNGIPRQFTGERGQNLDKAIYEGSDSKPLLDIKNADLIDPTVAIERGFQQIAKTVHYDDAKRHAFNSFIEEFGHVLVEKDKNILRQNPQKYFFNPQWDTFTASKEDLRLAQTVHKSIEKFFGHKTILGSQLDVVNAKLADGFFGDYLSEFQIPTSNDPFRVFRATAFNLKLGLFNPVQLWLQMQTMGNVVAISPRHAVQSTAGTAAMAMYRVSNRSEKMLNHSAELMTKMGWKKDDFIEAVKELESTGWDIIGGEVANLDALLEPSLKQSAFGTILDKGKMFFASGERQVRTAAWMTAFREFKEKNPLTKKLSSRNRNDILVRANTLAANMTRASNANWQEGVFSIPTQFFSYQIRMMELYAGKQLTTIEKGRMLLFHSALYGVPLGLGGAAAIPYAIGGSVSNQLANTSSTLNIYDDIRLYLQGQGIDPDEEAVGAIMNGLIGAITTLATGENIDANERLSPGGFGPLEDILTGDSGLLDIIIGPSGNILGDVMKSMYPMVGQIASVFDNRVTPSFQDSVTEVIRNASSANSLITAHGALNAGAYITKNGTTITDVNKQEAMLITLGFKPREINDTFRFMKKLDLIKEAEKVYRREFFKYMKKGHLADTEEDAARYFELAKGAVAAGGFRIDEHSRMMRQFYRSNPDLFKTMQQKYQRKTKGR